jgi:hypothetical protein
MHSDFGARFRQAAEVASTKTKHDGFDSAFIEIPSKDQRTFMEHLQKRS